MDEIIHSKGKIYYTMGEVTEMFGVNASLLRYWEQNFDELRPHRNKKGNRLYTPQDVDLVRTIYHLVKEKKMKIEVARKHLKEKKTDVDRDALIVERLMSVRAILQEIKNDLSYDGYVLDEDYDEAGVDESRLVETGKERPKNRKSTTKHIVGTAIEDKTAADNKAKSVQSDLLPLDKSGENTENNIVPMPPPFEEQMLFKLRDIETSELTQTFPDSDDSCETENDKPEEYDSHKQLIIEQTLF